MLVACVFGVCLCDAVGRVQLVVLIRAAVGLGGGASMSIWFADVVLEGIFCHCLALVCINTGVGGGDWSEGVPGLESNAVH